MILLLLQVFGVLIALSFVVANIKHRKQAPGPIAFPYLGHMPYFSQYEKLGIHKLFTEWCKKYGPVIEVQFARKRGVVITDYNLIKEAFQIPALCGRFDFPISRIRSGPDGVQRGIIFAQGEKWVEQRRFALRHLRDFGFGKHSMESIILDEALDLIEGFKKDVGQPISTQLRFNSAVVNTLWTIIAGERFRHDDPKLARLVANVTQNLTDTGTSGLVIFMPTLAQMFPNVSGWNTYLESFYETNTFIRKFVQSRRKTHDSNYINDFTGAYIRQINSTNDPNSSFYEQEGENNLVTVLDDLFSAGGETTSTTMTWLFLVLAMHPEIQDELCAEIERVIGKNRLPSLADKPLMPFAEAVLLETFRVSSVVSTGVYHYTWEDYEFHGILIPKNTMVVPNLYGVHHDPEIWGDPEVFRPNRFLSPDKQTVVKHEALIPFSTGKRVCPGETLARDELFLFITSILQKFVIGPDPNGAPLTLQQYVNGLVSVPTPHKIVLQHRS